MSLRRQRMPVRGARSAGGVVWRQRPDGAVEFAVGIRGGAEGVVCLAKGTPEPGEKLLDTALREVQEETGLVVEAGERLGATDYWFVAEGARIHKVVHWWLMRAAGGDVANHDAEFDAVEWVSAGEAVTRLTFPDERMLVEKALQQIETMARS